MKVGLVFSGGGGKGAYELGVWRALKEMKVDKYIKAVSGASIGAINAALFVQDDLDKAIEMWKEVTLEKMVPISNSELIKKGVALTLGSMNMNVVKKYLTNRIQHGDVPRDGAKAIIDKYINVDKLKERKMNLYVSCTAMPEFVPEYFKVNLYEEPIIKSILLGTACLPMIYESEEIFGKCYLDGGLVDNTPIKPLYDEGCDIIIAVLLSREIKIEREKFPNAKIIEIIPSEIESKVLEGLLNLDEEAKNRRIENGYNDTRHLLEPIFEISRCLFEEEAEEMRRKEAEDAKNNSWWGKLTNRYNKLKGEEKRLG